DLGPQFLSPLDGALMLGAVIMSLLPQSDYFGSQQPVLLLERGLFLPQRTCLRLARLLGDHHACRATIADCLRRVPQKIAPRRFFLQTRSPNIYPNPIVSLLHKCFYSHFSKVKRNNFRPFRPALAGGPKVEEEHTIPWTALSRTTLSRSSRDTYNTTSTG